MLRTSLAKRNCLLRWCSHRIHRSSIQNVLPIAHTPKPLCARHYSNDLLLNKFPEEPKNSTADDDLTNDFDGSDKNEHHDIFEDNYFSSLEKIIKQNNPENMPEMPSTNFLKNGNVSLLHMELQNKDEKKDDQHQLDIAMKILENTATGGRNDTTANNNNSSYPKYDIEPEEDDAYAATRGTKLKPPKEDIVVLSQNRFNKNSHRRRNFGYQNQQTESIMKNDEYAFMRGNVPNTASLNKKDTQSITNNPIEMTKLNITVESIEKLMSQKETGKIKKMHNIESIAEAINFLKPSGQSISADYNEHLIKELNFRFTKGQFVQFLKHQKENIIISSHALKAKLAQQIIHDVWDCQINQKKVHEHEEIMYLDKIQSFLLFLGDENFETYRYLYERNISVSVELGSFTEDDQLKSLISIKGTKEQCRLGEVYIRAKLKKFKIYNFNVDDIVEKHFGNVEDFDKKVNLKTVVEYIQSEVGSYIEPVNEGDYTKCYFHTSTGKEKFSRARRLLLSILQSNFCSHESVVDLTPKEEKDSITKYPNPDIESLLWHEKNKVYFRDRLPVKRYATEQNAKKWTIDETKVDEIYQALEKTESSVPDHLDIKLDEISTNISIQIGSYMEADDNTHTFTTKLADFNEKVLKLPPVNEVVSETVEEAGTVGEREIETDDNFEELTIRNEKEGVYLDSEDELTLLTESPVTTMTVLNFLPKLTVPTDSDLEANTKQLTPPPMEMWFEKSSDKVKPDILSVRCLLPLKENHIILKTPQLKFDAKIIKDTYIQLLEPYYEKHETIDQDSTYANSTQEEDWLKDQEGLKKYFGFLDNMRIFNVHNLPRLLTINLPLANGDVLKDVEYDIVSMKEVSLLNVNYMNKYVTQFSDIKNSELNCYTNQIDFVGGPHLSRPEFGNFLKSVLKF